MLASLVSLGHNPGADLVNSLVACVARKSRVWDPPLPPPSTHTHTHPKNRILARVVSKYLLDPLFTIFPRIRKYGSQILILLCL